MSGPADQTEDFVATLLDVLRTQVRGIDGEALLRVEEAVRAAYGGERVYIHRVGWCNRAARDARIREQSKAGWTIRQLAREHSLGVATVHGILGGLIPMHQRPRKSAP